MERKAIFATAISTLVAIVVTGAVGYATGVWNQGTEALAKAQIEKIVDERLNEKLTTDDGLTHAQALAQIDRSLARIETQVEGFQDDITDIRNAVRALAQ